MKQELPQGRKNSIAVSVCKDDNADSSNQREESEESASCKSGSNLIPESSTYCVEVTLHRLYRVRCVLVSFSSDTEKIRENSRYA